MIKDRSKMTIKYDSFTGFTFGDYHTSQFHLIRTSDGSRYNDETFAQAKDTTITVPGMDGSLYISSQRQNRVFNLKFAYDGLTEEDIFDIREWFASDKEQKLIFDERPYCYYMGKVTGTPKLSYICFDDPDSPRRRIYKGEGTVTITCYYPYAKSLYKSQEEQRENLAYVDKETNETKYFYEDIEQWVNSAVLPETAAALPEGGDVSIQINNTGHMPMHFRMLLSANKPTGKIQVNGKTIMELSDLDWAEKDKGGIFYIYDSELHLFFTIPRTRGTEIPNSYAGLSIANTIIKAGDFFQIPTNSQKISTTNLTIKQIEYSYIYY